MNIHLLKKQRENITLRFRRGLRRLIYIKRYGYRLGIDIEFSNFSFGQSIEQTTQTMMEDEEFDEMQNVKHRLLEVCGKVWQLSSTDFILVMIERIGLEAFFRDETILSEIKDWIISQRHEMEKQTKVVLDVFDFFKK